MDPEQIDILASKVGGETAERVWHGRLALRSKTSPQFQIEPTSRLATANRFRIAR